MRMDEILNAIVRFLFPVGMIALQCRVAFFSGLPWRPRFIYPEPK